MKIDILNSLLKLLHKEIKGVYSDREEHTDSLHKSTKQIRSASAGSDKDRGEFFPQIDNEDDDKKNLAKSEKRAS